MSFSHELYNPLDTYGRRLCLILQVKVFRELNKKVQQFCFSKQLKKDRTIRLELKTRWEEEFLFRGITRFLVFGVSDMVY